MPHVYQTVSDFSVAPRPLLIPSLLDMWILRSPTNPGTGSLATPTGTIPSRQSTPFEDQLFEIVQRAIGVSLHFGRGVSPHSSLLRVNRGVSLQSSLPRVYRRVSPHSRVTSRIDRGVSLRSSLLRVIRRVSLHPSLPRRYVLLGILQRAIGVSLHSGIPFPWDHT